MPEYFLNKRIKEFIATKYTENERKYSIILIRNAHGRILYCNQMHNLAIPKIINQHQEVDVLETKNRSYTKAVMAPFLKELLNDRVSKRTNGRTA